jgi:hypothetical protein
MLRHLWLFVAGSMAFATGACSGKTERAPASDEARGTNAARPVAGSNEAAARPAAAPARHLLLVVELEPAAHLARTLLEKSVDLPMPTSRGPVRQTRFRADVVDRKGQVLFSSPVDGSLEVRGEFPDEHGELHGTTVPQPKTSVTLRLPWLEGASEVVLVSHDRAAGDSELGRVAYPQVAR